MEKVLLAEMTLKGIQSYQNCASVLHHLRVMQDHTFFIATCT